MNTIWEFEHTAVADAPRESAWGFWSDVRNWAFDPSVEWIRLDGPFRTGASGVTKPRGQEPTEWRLAEVRPCEGALIEMETPGAAVSFRWQFEDIDGRRTRLTQRIAAEGPGVAEYTEEMRAEFARGVREGMAALAHRMAEAARAKEDAARIEGDAGRARGETPHVEGEATRVEGEAPRVKGEVASVARDAERVNGDAGLVEGDGELPEGEADILVRAERAEDAAAVRLVNELAFGSAAEADLVDALRANARPHVSLVATDEGGRVVGHILFSPVTIEPEAAGDMLMGLAPMAVLPERQKGGVGSRLVREGLEACRRLGCAVVVVLGHPDYYPRFGFAPASRLGLRCTYDVPDEVFMAQELVPGALAGRRGLVRYRPEFDAV